MPELPDFEEIDSKHENLCLKWTTVKEKYIQTTREIQKS